MIVRYQDGLAILAKRKWVARLKTLIICQLSAWDPVDRKRREAAAAYPVHQPRYGALGDEERANETYREHGGAMTFDPNRFALPRMAHELPELVAPSSPSSRDQNQERKLQRRRAGKARQFAGGNGLHRARCAGKTAERVWQRPIQIA